MPGKKKLQEFTALLKNILQDLDKISHVISDSYKQAKTQNSDQKNPELCLKTINKPLNELKQKLQNNNLGAAEDFRSIYDVLINQSSNNDQELLNQIKKR